MSRKRGDNSPLYEALSPVKLTTNIIEQMYLRLFGEMAINRFKWTGLPEEIDPRFVEMTLYLKSLSVFFHTRDLNTPDKVDKYNKYMCLRGAGAGGYDMYDNYLEFIVYGNTMLSGNVGKDECVPIWGNALRVPAYDVVTTYANRLAKIDRSIDSMIVLLRNPVVIGVPQSQRLSMINMWRMAEEGQPVIIGTETALDNVKDNMAVFPTGVEGRTLHDLQIAKTRIWNEAMTFLGVNNANQEKKERLVADEVAANDSQVIAFRNSELAARKLAVDKINKKYGLNVDVEWNQDSGAMLTDQPSLGQENIDDNNEHKRMYRE